MATKSSIYINPDSALPGQWLVPSDKIVSEYRGSKGAHTPSYYKRNKNLVDAQNNILNKLGSNDKKSLENFMRDAIFTGSLNGNTNKTTLAAFTKLKNNNYDITSLDKKDKKAVAAMLKEQYKNNDLFKYQLDKDYQDMSYEDKMKYLDFAGGGSLAPVPAPAYLDTSFDNYQKKVEPVKYYTNKELADLYKIDYDFDSIKKDLDDAAEAAVIYSNWQSELAKNNAERDNIVNQTSYLDAIRNIKSEAVQKGMSTGARSAAELLANKEAVQNKALLENQTAQQRFETMNDSLLNRAQTEINALSIYDKLAQTLSSNTGQLYANDINRYGQDLLSNANFLSADENLRSNRAAQNNLMAAYYNAAKAQQSVYSAQANEPYNYFKDISMPANDYNFNKALSDYIGLAYSQNTGYSDPMAKWGSGAGK